MSGKKRRRKIQLGRESSRGTEVNATTIWRGLGTPQDERETVFVDEDIGYLAPTDRAYQPDEFGTIEMEPVPATFEQLLHLLEGGVKTVSPSQDGAGDAYISEYPLTETTPNTVKPYTIEAGDDQAADVLTGGFVDSITLEGGAREAWTMGGGWGAQQIADGSFTAALSAPTVETILFGNSKLYIDAIDGAFGSTQVSNAFLKASLTLNTGITPFFCGHGELYYSHLEYTRPTVEMGITFLHDSDGAAQREVWRTNTPKLVRIIVEGSTFSNAGNTYSVKTLILDFAGRWSNFNKLGEEDGVNIVEGTFRAGYSATAAEYGLITVVHDLTTIP